MRACFVSRKNDDGFISFWCDLRGCEVEWREFEVWFFKLISGVGTRGGVLYNTCLDCNLLHLYFSSCVMWGVDCISAVHML